MAAIDLAEFTEETLQTHTGDTAYTTKFTVAAANWVANATYLVIVTARVGGSDNSDLFGWKMNRATGGDIVDSEQFLEPAAVSGGVAKPQTYRWWGIYDVPATAENINFQMKTNDGANTAAADAISLIKLRLDDDLTEDTEWRFDEDTSDTTLTTSDVTFADTGSFTPGTPTDHRLILALFRVAVNDVTHNHDFVLEESIAGGSFAAIGGRGSAEGENLDDIRLYAWGWVDDSGSSGSRQYRIRVSDDESGTQSTHLYSSIFVLEVNAFESHDEDLVTTPLVGDAGLQVLNALAAYSATTTGDHLVLTMQNVDLGSVNSRWNKGLEIDDVDADADFLSQQSGSGHDVSDKIPWLRARVKSLSTTAQKVEQVGSGLPVQGAYDERMLLVLSAELAAAPPAGAGKIIIQNAA